MEVLEVNMNKINNIINSRHKKRRNRNLEGCRAELVTSATLGDLGEVVDQPLEDVGSVQVAVVVDVDVHHALGV